MRTALIAALIVGVPSLARADWTVPAILRVPEMATSISVARAGDHWMVLSSRTLPSTEIGLFSRAIANDGTVTPADGSFLESSPGPWTSGVFACGATTCLVARADEARLTKHDGTLATALASLGTVTAAVWNGTRYVIVANDGAGVAHLRTVDETGALGVDHTFTALTEVELGWNGSEVVAVHRTSIGGPLEAHRFTSDGAPIGGSISISSETYVQSALAPRGTGWAVAVQTSATTITVTLHDAALTKTKTLTFSGYGFDLASVGSETWLVFGDGGSSIRSARIDAAGTLLDATPNLVTSGSTSAGLRIHRGGAGALVVRDRDVVLLGGDAKPAVTTKLTTSSPQLLASIAARSDGAIVLWKEGDGSGPYHPRLAHFGSTGLAAAPTLGEPDAAGVVTTFSDGYLQVFATDDGVLRARKLSADGTPSTPFTIDAPTSLISVYQLAATEGPGGAFIGWTTRTSSPSPKYRTHVAHVSSTLVTSKLFDLDPEILLGSMACTGKVCWITSGATATVFDEAGKKGTATIGDWETSIGASASRFFVEQADVTGTLTAQIFDPAGVSTAPAFDVAIVGRVGAIAGAPSGGGILTWNEKVSPTVHVVRFDEKGALSGEVVLENAFPSAIAVGAQALAAWSQTDPSEGIQRLHVRELASPPVDAGADATPDASPDATVDSAVTDSATDSSMTAVADTGPDAPTPSEGSCAYGSERDDRSRVFFVALCAAVAAARRRRS